MFYIDLDEIETLSKKLTWFSYNKFNLFNFRDKDHLPMEDGKCDMENGGHTKPSSIFPVTASIKKYLKNNGVIIGNGKIMLLTNLCVLGYNFNPVSFYFCFDEDENPLCAVAEISNTYREMKLFFFSKEDLQHNRFKKKAQKFFYVSPFIDLDTFFDFNLGIPTEKLDINIDDYDKEDRRFFLTTLKGEKKPLTNGNMLRYFFAIPLIPLQVMWFIHWQAFKLWMKKINYHPKATNQHLQKDVYKPYKP
jgi:DUF1365 family protein